MYSYSHTYRERLEYFPLKIRKKHECALGTSIQYRTRGSNEMKEAKKRKASGVEKKYNGFYALMKLLST